MTSFRIGTWNTEYALGELKNQLRLTRLQKEFADLWVLTETDDKLDLSATHEPVCSAPRPNRRPGQRCTAIWTRWPVLEPLTVDDPTRTVAAVLDSPAGPLIAIGTVLPWHSDVGPSPGVPARYWAEHFRVLPLQIAEWKRFRQKFPELPLVVAGDMNMNLGGKHHYGTTVGRQILRNGLADLGLICATEADRIPAGALRYPAIDHVLLPSEWGAGSHVAAWEGTTADGSRLSDHSGLIVDVEVPLSQEQSHVAGRQLTGKELVIDSRPGQVDLDHASAPDKWLIEVTDRFTERYREDLAELADL